MNTMAGTMQETALSDKMAAQTDFEAPQSALLGETSADELFSMFFGSTWSHNDNGYGNWHTSWGTPLLNDQPISRASGFRTLEDVQRQEQGPIAKTNNDRVTLLARKYVSKEQISEEDTARLAILTARIRELMPAATAKEFESVIEVLKAVQRVTKSNKDIRALLDKE